MDNTTYCHIMIYIYIYICMYIYICNILYYVCIYIYMRTILLYSDKNMILATLEHSMTHSVIMHGKVEHYESIHASICISAWQLQAGTQVNR